MDTDDPSIVHGCLASLGIFGALILIWVGVIIAAVTVVEALTW